MNRGAHEHRAWRSRKFGTASALYPLSSLVWSRGAAPLRQRGPPCHLASSRPRALPLRREGGGISPRTLRGQRHAWLTYTSHAWHTTLGLASVARPRSREGRAHPSRPCRKNQQRLAVYAGEHVSGRSASRRRIGLARKLSSPCRGTADSNPEERLQGRGWAEVQVRNISPVRSCAWRRALRLQRYHCSLLVSIIL